MTGERQGMWGTAGDLPVQDRPTAGRLPNGPGSADSGNHRSLVAIHDHLRAELRQIQQAVRDVASGELNAAAARSLINRLSLRQNRWTLGSFCAQYCRVVTMHHTIEDTHMFPALAAAAPQVEPVLRRLGEEHEVIAELLDRFDRALVRLVDGSHGEPSAAGPAEIGRLAAALSDLLLSHLSYEEGELAEALGLLSGSI